MDSETRAGVRAVLVGRLRAVDLHTYSALANALVEVFDAITDPLEYATRDKMAGNLHAGVCFEIVGWYDEATGQTLRPSKRTFRAHLPAAEGGRIPVYRLIRSDGEAITEADEQGIAVCPECRHRVVGVPLDKMVNT